MSDPYNSLTRSTTGPENLFYYFYTFPIQVVSIQHGDVHILGVSTETHH